MNRKLYLFIIIQIVFLQPLFSYTDKVSEIKNNDMSIIWLSRSSTLPISGSNRLILQFGYSFANVENRKIINYPDIDFGLKLMKNMSITSKIVGLSFGEYSSHNIGFGMQYFYGREDTLNWISSIQRAVFKIGSDFKITSISMDVKRLIKLKSMQFRIGIGSSFYKKFLFDDGINKLINKENQINFLSLETITTYRVLNLGFHLNITPKGLLSSIFIQKEFL